MNSVSNVSQERIYWRFRGCHREEEIDGEITQVLLGVSENKLQRLEDEFDKNFDDKMMLKGKEKVNFPLYEKQIFRR